MSEGLLGKRNFVEEGARAPMLFDDARSDSSGVHHNETDSLRNDDDGYDTRQTVSGFARWLVRRRIILGLLRRPLADRLRRLRASAGQWRVDTLLTSELLTRLSSRRMLLELGLRSRSSAELVVVRTINEWLLTTADGALERASKLALKPLRAPAFVQEQRRRPDRENVILVVHQASRTGAPVLAWNIASRLAQRYNLFTVLLAGGPLVSAFTELSVELYGPFVQGRPYPADINHSLRAMLNERPFKYAIVNSCESRAAMGVLARRGIPTILLMHEFGAYVYPPSELRAAFDLADEIVFPAEMVAQSSRAAHPTLAGRTLHILPQGVSVVPQAASRITRTQSVQVRDLARARKDGAFIVLGAGTVELRKGVDVFLSTAAAVVRQAQGERVQFLWVGRGYRPGEDMAYSVYLKEQIARAGLKDRVSFLDELPQLEPIYAQTDVFLLSSRLDPMPNVAIDAAWRGIPVVCFEKASGIADLLLKDPLTASGVAGYLDTDAAASAIVSLARNPARHAAVSCSTKGLAGQVFDMQAYVERLDALGSDSATMSPLRRRRLAS